MGSARPAAARWRPARLLDRPDGRPGRAGQTRGSGAAPTGSHRPSLPRRELRASNSRSRSGNFVCLKSLVSTTVPKPRSRVGVPGGDTDGPLRDGAVPASPQPGRGGHRAGREG
ncbi:hypothetical protein GCM10010357_22570 [Streptomyces luteireticuli]|uniref:Uncharacterized protein n=1 Tax=Streptomyces luteireticuli TaxID=173858 RepID=A0ABN0YMY2_9ACTN